MKNFMLILTGFLVFGCGEKNEWTPLFNGKDLKGWHIYQKKEENYNGWYVEDEVLVFDPAKRSEASNSDLVTDKQFTNFELSVEWMISEEGNSGIF